MGREMGENVSRLKDKLYQFKRKEIGNLFDPETIKEEKIELLRAKLEVKTTEQVLNIVTIVGKEIQRKAHSQVSSIVSKCLKTIFGPDTYEFEFQFKEQRDKTAIRLVFIKDGEEFDPKDEMGGGVLEVAAFALRLSALVLTRPKARRIMILDEPFKNIRGEEYRSRVRDLIISLSEELEVQFILNIDTDVYPEFEIGKVIRL